MNSLAKEEQAQAAPPATSTSRAIILWGHSKSVANTLPVPGH